MMVVDIETSGDDPEVHSILSIGAVDFGRPGNTFYGECRIRQGAHFKDEALAVNGFSEREINDPEKMTENELVELFAEWVKGVEDATIAGHNVHFDLAFLRHAVRLYRIELSLGSRIVDMHSLAYASMMSNGLPIPLQLNRTAITSDTVFRYVGIEEEPTPHNALTGATMEAEAISRLVLGRSLIDAFKGFEVPKHLRRGGAPTKQ